MDLIDSQKGGIMEQEKRPIIILAALLVATILLSGTYIIMISGDDDGDADVEFTQILDAMNLMLRLDGSPETIVSTAPSITEILYQMGYGDRIVAASDYTTYPQEAVDRMALPNSDPNYLPSMGSYWSPNVELITNISADVVFITLTSGSVEVYDSLKEMGQTVVMLHQEASAADIYKNYWLILNVMNPPSSTLDVEAMMDSAAALYDMRQSIKAVKEKMESGTVDKQFLIHLGWSTDLSEDVWAVGANTFISAGAELANMTENTANFDGFAQISKEFYLANGTNPEIIISVGWHWAGFDNHGDLMAALIADPVWGATDAVQNNKVYVFEGRAEEITSRASPQAYGDLVKLLAMVLQPQVFDAFTPPHVIGSDYADLFDGQW